MFDIYMTTPCYVLGKTMNRYSRNVEKEIVNCEVLDARNWTVICLAYETLGKLTIVLNHEYCEARRVFH